MFMPILKKLKELFEQAQVPYEVFNHALAYTAQGSPPSSMYPAMKSPRS
jgi:hypothetical protein